MAAHSINYYRNIYDFPLYVSKSTSHQYIISSKYFILQEEYLSGIILTRKSRFLNNSLHSTSKVASLYVGPIKNKNKFTLKRTP